MTRDEFIQNAVISMASKVIGTNGITDGDDWSHAIDEAEDLANQMEQRGWL